MQASIGYWSAIQRSACDGAIDVASPGLVAFTERLYFSASTYASLGLGDIAPLGDFRMLAVVEVLNGLVLIGWTISFTYLAMETFWSSPKTHSK